MNTKEMNVLERLKFLRKNILKLTQEEFAKSIDISRSNYGSLETGAVSLTNRNFKMICTKYNISEIWLREGIEPIFRKQSLDEEIAAYMGDVLSSKDTDFQKRLILALSKLDDDGWNVLETLLNNIVSTKKD